jgi:hypothetical protein
MNKSRRKGSSVVPAVDPEELGFALQLFQAGLRVKLPMESPEKKGIEFGDVGIAQMMLAALPQPLREQFIVRDSRVAPRDTRLHRAMFAVLNHYKDHKDREAISNRVMAFYFLVNKGGMKPFRKWTKPSDIPEATMMHPAVVEAMAVTPMPTQAVFEAKTFFETVDRIAKEKYPEEGK